MKKSFKFRLNAGKAVDKTGFETEFKTKSWNEVSRKLNQDPRLGKGKIKSKIIWFESKCVTATYSDDPDATHRAISCYSFEDGFSVKFIEKDLIGI